MNSEENKQLGKLIMQLASGDLSALEGISISVEGVLLSIGSCYYRNYAEAEDAVYNLYLELEKKAKSFTENVNAKAWLVRTFENYIKSEFRKQARERRFMQQAILDLKTNAKVVDEKYLENRLFLREIFDKLTPFECRLLIYYHWCQCTIREVAQYLHKPKSTIALRLKKLEEKVKNFYN